MLEWIRGSSTDRTASLSRVRAWWLRLLGPATFLLCCLPLAKLGIDALTGGLSADPIATGLNRLGFWALTFLALSLTPTPMKDFLGISWPIRLRRMLGLFAFAYAVLHFAWYLGIDQFFAFGEIWNDVVKRKFITFGFIALLLLVPLAATSTRQAVSRLGYRRWKRLHRLVYLAAILGVFHFVWRVKADQRRPEIFAVVIGLLLLLRAANRLRQYLVSCITSAKTARSGPSGPS